MKNFSATRWLFPLLLLSTGKPVFSQDLAAVPYQDWIDYRDGEVSIAFNQIPVEVALNAIRAETGLQIIVPSAAVKKVLSLQLTRVPLEPAVRSFISNIGFKNFALMYDSDGHPKRAVVLATLPENGGSPIGMKASPAPAKEPAVQPLTADERAKLEKALQRWSELKQEERGRIEDRLKELDPSEERDELIAEYGRRILGIKNPELSVPQQRESTKP